VKKASLEAWWKRGEEHASLGIKNMKKVLANIGNIICHEWTGGKLFNQNRGKVFNQNLQFS